MKRYYTFTVHESYAGSRDGEIEVEIETDDISSERYNIDRTRAEEIAYDMYIDGKVSWEDLGSRTDDQSETDFNIDFDSSRVFDDDGNEIRVDEDDLKL